MTSTDTSIRLWLTKGTTEGAFSSLPDYIACRE